MLSITGACSFATCCKMNSISRSCCAYQLNICCFNILLTVPILVLIITGVRADGARTPEEGTVPSLSKNPK